MHGEAALQTAHQATSAFFNSDTLTAEQCGAAAASGAGALHSPQLQA